MIKIICIGKIKEQYLKDLVSDYLKRLTKYHKVNLIELPDSNINNDDYIDVGDISAVVKYIQEQPDSKFVAIAADANMDDDIDVGDITAIVDLIIAEGHRSPISKRTINSTIPLMYDFYANTYVFTNSHTQQDVAVYLDYEGDITGFQCELIVPEGFTIPQDTLGNYMIKLNPNRVSNMNIKEILRLSDQRYQILCSSTNKALLTDNNGEIISVDFNTIIVNKILDEANGVKVLEIPSAELVNGRGGPHCLSMALIREDDSSTNP